MPPRNPGKAKPPNIPPPVENEDEDENVSSVVIIEIPKVEYLVGDEWTEAALRLDQHKWILRKEIANRQGLKYSEAVSVFKQKENKFTIAIFAMASLTSSFSLGSVNASSSMVKYMNVGISFVTTIISGLQKIKSYPEKTDKGLKLAEDWKSLWRDINLRLNKADDNPEPEELDKIIDEKKVIDTMGSLNVQSIGFLLPRNNYLFPNTVTKQIEYIRNAEQLLDKCVALIASRCTQEQLNEIDFRIRGSIPPDYH